MDLPNSRVSTRNGRPYLSTPSGGHYGHILKCSDCGAEVFVNEYTYKKKMNKAVQCKLHRYCKHNSSMWKGGRRIDRLGYVRVHKPEHPACTKRRIYVMEHRIVMEKHLGRYLKSAEVVHHINMDRADNRLSNLMLFPNSGAHNSFHKSLRIGGKSV